MTVYDPWVVKRSEGEVQINGQNLEVLLSLYWDEHKTVVESATIAFRSDWNRTWSAPITLERAP